MQDCLFCKIIRAEIPSTKVFEDDELLAFNDISPASKTHVLIIPKKHYDSLREVEDSKLLGAILHRAKLLAEELGIAEAGYRTVINTGKNGGQTVGHLHLHLLGGRAHGWPPG